MKANITELREGTKFTHKNLEYQVTSREEYPFIITKCLTEPNEYEGYEVMFWNFDEVEVPEGTKVIKPSISIVRIK